MTLDGNENVVNVGYDEIKNFCEFSVVQCYGILSLQLKEVCLLSSL